MLQNYQLLFKDLKFLELLFLYHLSLHQLFSSLRLIQEQDHLHLHQHLLCQDHLHLQHLDHPQSL